MSENKITFPAKLASNNPQSFGIADATEVSGHKSVDTLSGLYAISDPLLSILKDGSDAIGQEWFVVSEDCKYRLDNWENRKSVTGWTKLPKQELINTKQSVSEKDQPGGYAGLDSNGKLPIEKTYGTTATVVEVETYESLPVTGLSGVIYYVSNTRAQYKWSGSVYIDITDGADNAKKNETSIFDCSNGTSTKYYSSLSAAINVVPPVYRTSNRIISYLSTENATTTAVNYQYNGIDSTTWTDLTKWERIPNQADLAEIRSDLNELDSSINNLNELDGSINNLSGIIIKKDCKNVLVGIGTATPIAPFHNQTEGKNNPKVENVVDTGSPFKDILGYYTKISNTKSVSEISFLNSANDFILSRPNNIKFSFFTKKSDWDTITEGFLFGLSIHSYAPTATLSNIKFDIKNVIAGNKIASSFTGTTCDGNYTVKKSFEQNGFCQILLDINVTTWKLSAEAGIRPLIQLSNMQPKWVNKSFLMINQQMILDNILESGIYVYPDTNDVIDFYYPESVYNLIDQNIQSIAQLEAKLEDKLEVVYNGNDCINQINRIGTASPSMYFLQNANENLVNGGYPKVENVVDTGSPFKDILGYLTRFSNTQTSDASNFKFEPTEVRVNRPTLISVGFWVKKSQFTGIGFSNNMFFSSYTHSPTILVISHIPISQLVDKGVGFKITSNITSNLFNLTSEMYKAFEVGDWCQIIVNYKNIVWNVDETTKWKYGFGFNHMQSKWINQSKDYANFQISEDKELPIGIFVIQDVSNSMIVFPPSFKDINNLIDQNIQSIAQLDEQIQSLSKKTNLLVYDKNDNAISYVQSPFNSTYDLRLYFAAKRSATSNNNPCFNFSSVYLVNKTTSAKTLVHTADDNIAPANYNGTYIGANHGCDKLRAVTANNHGKTFADIGSEWSNGTYKFYIIGIIDVNTLWILGENSKVYPLWSFRTVDTGNILTHVSGATNASDITVSNSTIDQFYPSLFVSDLKLIADGTQITESGTYNFDELNVCETYDVFNVASTLEKIKALVGTFETNPIYNQLGADKVARHSINYKFSSASKCFVNTNFIAYQNIEIGYFGFIQQDVLSGSNVRMYIPKALPIMDGATQKDYRTIADHNVVNNQMNLTSEYWENPLLPPDRYIQASENIAFNGGYLFDYGIGGTKRKDFINNAFYLYTSRKVYPHGIDSQITVTGSSKYSAVCFRIYTDIDNFNKNGIINQNSFEYEGNLYIYADFNNSGFFELDVLDKFIGKNINILEKSNNIEILSDTTNSKILIKVNASVPLYGYVILKI